MIEIEISNWFKHQIKYPTMWLPQDVEWFKKQKKFYIDYVGKTEMALKVCFITDNSLNDTSIWLPKTVFQVIRFINEPKGLSTIDPDIIIKEFEEKQQKEIREKNRFIKINETIIDTEKLFQCKVIKA